MNIKTLFASSNRREDGRKIRYAVMGAGWIAQEDFMPGIQHTGNSQITAIITGDGDKARALAGKYDVPHIYAYEQYAAALRSGNFDAIYLATPNARHLEFAVPALEAGIHVLLEKPMAPTEDDCRTMIAASERSGARLMVAYRLHFDEATLHSLTTVRGGKIGIPRFFSCAFGQQVSGSNSRAGGALWAGPLPDMGPYPINAARMFFGAEPIEVFAFRANSGEKRFAEIEEMVSVLLRFPGDKLAQFTVSYGVNPVSECRIVGTKGDLRLSPAFAYDRPIEQWLTVGDDTQHTKFAHRDQFGGETKYFSDCILDGRQPEPDGEEGLADVRVMNAIEESLRRSRSVVLGRSPAKIGPQEEQVVKLPAVPAGELIHAAPPEG
jgi:predicted dehydrogenase